MKSGRRISTYILAFVLIVSTVRAQEPNIVPATEGQDRLYSRGVVAADHPLASLAGLEILQAGGNVVDAAVATSFALSVVRPCNCGIGGGGFMVIWNAERGQAIALDYRERAPLAATRDMYADPQHPNQVREGLSRRGHLATAVPGTVAGLCFALEKYGTLELKTVLQPAIRLARDGFGVDRYERRIQTSLLKKFADHPRYRQQFDVLFEKYLNRGNPWDDEDCFCSPQLKVLELIAEQGVDGFYRGVVADALVAESRRGGGLLAHRDLTTFKPVVRRPLRGRFDDFEIVTMPPPSSGGVALLESLNILTACEKQFGKSLERLGHNSPEYLHLLVETMKHAFADRAEYLGDTDFAKVPMKRLIDPVYAKKLALKIDMTKTLPLESYGRYLPVDDAGTSHLSVIDHQGNAVACTETINGYFGSLVVEPVFGIVMNNEMDDFSAVPGQPNAFGLIQSEANAVQPGKKPLSSMTPTILVRNGKAVHALGGSGGPMIISSSLQVLLNLTRFGMIPAEAVSQPRVHHQWLPHVLFVEKSLLQRTERNLKPLKHQVRLLEKRAAVQAVSRNRHGVRGGSDPRKGGQPAGF